MSHRAAHYNVYVDSQLLGTYEYATRTDMVTHIGFVLAWADMAASAIRQADIRKRWGRIARHGSSVEHFVIENRDHRIAFDGLTEGEYHEATAAN